MTAGALIATLNLVACGDSPTPESQNFDVEADKISFELLNKEGTSFKTPPQKLKGQTDKAYQEVEKMLNSGKVDRVKVLFLDEQEKSVATYDCEIEAPATGLECDLL